MNKSWHSRRAFLATGATLTGTAIAGCIGAPASGETEASDRSPGEGDIRIQSADDLEEPGGGSDLAGTAGDGEPDWIDAHNMRFRGWYDADRYNPAMPYHNEDISLSIVNKAGYTVEIKLFDEDGNSLYTKRRNFAQAWWIRSYSSTTAEIRVLGSAQNEALEIDLTEGRHHEIWLSGAVLTASYWIGRW